jgi:hypothetical protein
MATTKRATGAGGAEIAGIRDAMLHKLAGSALDDKDAAKLQFKPITAQEAAELRLPSATEGFVIPYFGLDGRQTDFIRVRYLKETRKGFEVYSKKKALRYGQVPGTVNEVYMAPIVPWPKLIENPDIPLVITEGELKAACATKHGIPTIGLGGVWCFMSKRAGERLLPIFARLNLTDRTVYICYDSDAVTNPDVVSAELKLAERLAELGAKVLIARIPAEGDAKMGIDDYIVAHGAAQFKTQVLEQAFEYELSKALHAMNQRVAYVRNPGCVFSFEHDYEMRPTDFTGHQYANLHHTEKSVKADGGIKLEQVQTAAAWLKWTHRSELKGITFRPGADRITVDGYLNHWRAWGFTEPKRGAGAQPWRRLLDHLFGHSKAERQWFERWAAYPLQYPGKKLSSAVLIWGIGEGTGKTLMGSALMTLYGEHGTEVKDSDLEDSRFEWAANKAFVLADDITGQDNRKLHNKLKTMVTQKTMRINPKYIQSYSVPDCINYYFTSNDPDALFLSNGDRRYFVHEVLAGALPVALRKEFLDWIESEEGKNELAYHLLNLDLGDFDPGAAAFATEAKEEMKIHVKTEVGAWVAHLRDNMDEVLNSAGMHGDLYTTGELHALFDPAGEKRAGAIALGKELKKAGFGPPAVPVVKVNSGLAIRLISLRNRDKWAHATTKQVTDHYNQHHPLQEPKKRKY